MWQLSHPRDQWPRHLWRVTYSGTNSVAHPKDPQQRKLNFMDVDTTPGMYCLLLVAGDWYVTDGSHRI